MRFEDGSPHFAEGFDMKLRRALFVSLVVVPGCTIAFGPSDDDDVQGEQSQHGRFECPAWDSAGQKEVDALVAKTIEALNAEGVVVDNGAWEDAAVFGNVIDRVYDDAGCPLPEGEAQQALHAAPAPNFYCGPGHGHASLLRPPVSACINHACVDHDACYAMCTDEPSLACSWSAATASCDDPFMERLKQCDDPTFIDRVVVGMAGVLNEVPGTCDALECPAYGELGAGVCAVEPGTLECSRCLEEFDVEYACLIRSCVETPDDWFCYTANCPQVQPCFGGGWDGTSWADGCVDYTGHPEDYAWRIVVVQGTMPLTKSTGAPWDEGAFIGFDLPDPYVMVSLDGVGLAGETSAAEDDVYPTWNEEVVSQIASTEFTSELSFEAWDEDLVEDDLIGACVAAPAMEDFCQPALHASCDPPELDVVYRLLPVP